MANLITSFIVGYWLVMWVLALVVLLVQSSTPHSRHLQFWGAQGATRWVWLLVILGLAGFPPALFFFGKLSLIALFWSRGGIGLVLFLVAWLFLGWRVYFTLARREQGFNVAEVGLIFKQRRGCLVVGVFVIGLIVLMGGVVWGGWWVLLVG